MTEAIDARFLRSMLYEPLPGSAAVILAQLGIIEPGQVDALGARTYDAESARLSLALDDGRTVELERAMHLHTENGYAVRIRSRAGQTISRSFIHIDRNLGVRNLYNDRMVYIHDADLTHPYADRELSEAEIEANADQAHEAQLHESQTHDLHAKAEPRASSLQASAASSLEEQGIAASSLSEPDLGHLPRHSSLAESRVIEEDALETATEMLEILPEADIATILYFHETQSPEPALSEAPQATLGDSTAPSLPHLGLYPTNTAPEPRTQAEEPVATPASETVAVSEPVALSEILAAAEPSWPEPPSADSTEPSASDSISAAEVSPPVETPVIPASMLPQTPEPIAAAEPKPSELEISEPETDPEFAPLHAALTPSEAADFTFVAQTGSIHTYEHRETFRYIHIDASSGLFYDQTRTPISRIAALKRALTPQPTAISAAAVEEEVPTSSPEPQPTQALELQAIAAAASATPDHHPEPELRTRRIPAARAAVKPEAALETIAQDAPQGLSLDAFTRKHDSPLERQTLRNRIGDLSRVFRLGRNQNGSNGSEDS